MGRAIVNITVEGKYLSTTPVGEDGKFLSYTDDQEKAMNFGTEDNAKEYIRLYSLDPAEYLIAVTEWHS